MMRKRGRPPATAEDIKLLWYVRDARHHRGLTVDQAIHEGHSRGLLQPPGSTEDPIGALKTRYERINPAYSKLHIPDAVMTVSGQPPRKVRGHLMLGFASRMMERIRKIK